MTQNKLTPFAQQLRSEATKEEKRLWYEYLSTYPIRFRRQKVIGTYILDFYCYKVRLAVELDGSHHFDERALEKDEVRTRWLNQQGILVLRFLNSDIWNNLSHVCATIDDAVKERLSSLTT